MGEASGSTGSPGVNGRGHHLAFPAVWTRSGAPSKKPKGHTDVTDGAGREDSGASGGYFIPQKGFPDSADKK